MQVRLTLLLAFASTALLATPAGANDIRVYAGTISKKSYSSASYALEKFTNYVVIDHTAQQLAFIAYFKTGNYLTEMLALDGDYIHPNSPEITANSRENLSISSESLSVPVNVIRFRGTAKPRLTPVSSSASAYTSASLAYTRFVYAPAAYTYDETATFALQRALTIKINDANTNLNGAVTLALDDLRKKKKID